MSFVHSEFRGCFFYKRPIVNNQSAHSFVAVFCHTVRIALWNSPANYAVSEIVAPRCPAKMLRIAAQAIMTNVRGVQAPLRLAMREDAHKPMCCGPRHLGL